MAQYKTKTITLCATEDVFRSLFAESQQPSPPVPITATRIGDILYLNNASQHVDRFYSTQSIELPEGLPKTISSSNLFDYYTSELDEFNELLCPPWEPPRSTIHSTPFLRDSQFEQNKYIITTIPNANDHPKFSPVKGSQKTDEHLQHDTNITNDHIKDNSYNSLCGCKIQLHPNRTEGNCYTDIDDNHIYPIEYNQSEFSKIDYKNFSAKHEATTADYLNSMPTETRLQSSTSQPYKHINEVLQSQYLNQTNPFQNHFQPIWPNNIDSEFQDYERLENNRNCKAYLDQHSHKEINQSQTNNSQAILNSPYMLYPERYTSHPYYSEGSISDNHRVVNNYFDYLDKFPNTQPDNKCEYFNDDSNSFSLISEINHLSSLFPSSEPSFQHILDQLYSISDPCSPILLPTSKTEDTLPVKSHCINQQVDYIDETQELGVLMIVRSDNTKFVLLRSEEISKLKYICSKKNISQIYLVVTDEKLKYKSFKIFSFDEFLNQLSTSDSNEYISLSTAHQSDNKLSRNSNNSSHNNYPVNTNSHTKDSFNPAVKRDPNCFLSSSSVSLFEFLIQESNFPEALGTTIFVFHSTDNQTVQYANIESLLLDDMNEYNYLFLKPKSTKNWIETHLQHSYLEHHSIDCVQKLLPIEVNDYFPDFETYISPSPTENNEIGSLCDKNIHTRYQSYLETSPNSNIINSIEAFDQFISNIDGIPTEEIVDYYPEAKSLQQDEDNKSYTQLLGNLHANIPQKEDLCIIANNNKTVEGNKSTKAANLMLSSYISKTDNNNTNLGNDIANTANDTKTKEDYIDCIIEEDFDEDQISFQLDKSEKHIPKIFYTSSDQNEMFQLHPSILSHTHTENSTEILAYTLTKQPKLDAISRLIAQISTSLICFKNAQFIFEELSKIEADEDQIRNQYQPLLKLLINQSLDDLSINPNIKEHTYFNTKSGSEPRYTQPKYKKGEVNKEEDSSTFSQDSNHKEYEENMNYVTRHEKTSMNSAYNEDDRDKTNNCDHCNKDKEYNKYQHHNQHQLRIHICRCLLQRSLTQFLRLWAQYLPSHNPFLPVVFSSLASIYEYMGDTFLLFENSELSLVAAYQCYLLALYFLHLRDQIITQPLNLFYRCGENEHQDMVSLFKRTHKKIHRCLLSLISHYIIINKPDQHDNVTCNNFFDSLYSNSENTFASANQGDIDDHHPKRSSNNIEKKEPNNYSPETSTGYNKNQHSFPQEKARYDVSKNYTIYPHWDQRGNLGCAFGYMLLLSSLINHENLLKNDNLSSFFQHVDIESHIAILEGDKSQNNFPKTSKKNNPKPESRRHANTLDVLEASLYKALGDFYGRWYWQLKNQPPHITRQISIDIQRNSFRCIPLIQMISMPDMVQSTPSYIYPYFKGKGRPTEGWLSPIFPFFQSFVKNHIFHTPAVINIDANYIVHDNESNLNSGINFYLKGLRKLKNASLPKKFDSLYINLKQRMGHAYFALCEYYTNSGRFTKALIHCNQGLELFEAVGDKINSAKSQFIMCKLKLEPTTFISFSNGINISSEAPISEPNNPLDLISEGNLKVATSCTEALHEAYKSIKAAISYSQKSAKRLRNKKASKPMSNNDNSTPVSTFPNLFNVSSKHDEYSHLKLLELLSTYLAYLHLGIARTLMTTLSGLEFPSTTETTKLTKNSSITLANNKSYQYKQFIKNILPFNLFEIFQHYSHFLKGEEAAKGLCNEREEERAVADRIIHHLDESIRLLETDFEHLAMCGLAYYCLGCIYTRQVILFRQRYGHNLSKKNTRKLKTKSMKYQHLLSLSFSHTEKSIRLFHSSSPTITADWLYPFNDLSPVISAKAISELSGKFICLQSSCTHYPTIAKGDTSSLYSFLPWWTKYYISSCLMLKSLMELYPEYSGYKNKWESGLQTLLSISDILPYFSEINNAYSTSSTTTAEKLLFEEGDQNFLWSYLHMEIASLLLNLANQPIDLHTSQFDTQYYRHIYKIYLKIYYPYSQSHTHSHCSNFLTFLARLRLPYLQRHLKLQ